MRHVATLLAVAVLLPAPAALAAQEKRAEDPDIRRYRTWTADSVLNALATDGETGWAGRALLDIVAGRSELWQRLEGVASPLSRAERDAFVERLVSIATANPESAGADRIMMAMTDARYFDALLRMYEAGAGRMWHLIYAHPRRGIEAGMEKLAANRWRVDPRIEHWRPEDPAFRPKVPGFFEMCQFIRRAWDFGTLALVGGQPVFTFYEGADLSPGSDGRRGRWTKEGLDGIDDVTNELYEAGIIDTPCPHPAFGHYTKHDPPTPPRGR